MTSSHIIAAVDLGSNSFRLLISRIVNEDTDPHLVPIDAMKETVRLAAGLLPNNTLDDSAIKRAIEVLQRFGERLRNFSPERVRAVATNTFRVATNISELLPRAESALGFPIEVIAGREEARLIFTGVSHSLPPSKQRRLVIDIGGGSTELIIGQEFEPIVTESLFMGCVSFSKQFFSDGEITAARMKQAELAARREIESVQHAYRRELWQDAFGSSGTSKALEAILNQSGFCEHGISLQGLHKLRQTLIAAGSVERAKLAGIKPDRTGVLAGGLAIMLALFEELDIEIMDTADGALRLGVLYDMIGREAAHDKRTDTVKQFMQRYDIDQAQARRVRELSLVFFHDMVGSDHTAEDTELLKLLGWAADLHEAGLSIAHASFHKHSAYILENADMPGFSKRDQRLLATLVLGHAGKPHKLKNLVKSLPQWYGIMSLRLAALLCRRREDLQDIPLQVSGRNEKVVIKADHQWLAAHPLSDYTLRSEAAEWSKLGFEFQLMEV